MTNQIIGRTIVSAAQPLPNSPGRERLRLELDCGEKNETILLAIQDVPWFVSWFINPILKLFSYTDLTFIDEDGTERTVLVNINSAVKRLGALGNVQTEINQGNLNDCIRSAQRGNWSANLKRAAPHLTRKTVSKIVKVAKENLGGPDLRPVSDQCPRQLEFKDGRVLVHLTRTKEGDQVIGKGGEKVVRLAVDLITGEQFISARYKVAKNERAEISNMKAFQGKPHFPQVVNHYNYESIKHGESERLVSPYYNYYNLGSLESAQEKLTPEEKKAVFIQLVEAIDELHRAGYVHFDLKPANIFLHRGKDQKIQVIIGDLGAMCQPAVKQGYPVTPCYMPPEYVKTFQLSIGPAFPLVEKDSSAAADLWALGLTLYYVLEGEITPNGIYEAIEAWSRGKKYTFPARQMIINKSLVVPNSPRWLVFQMLEADPSRRITAAKAKEQLSKINWSQH